MSPGQTRFYSRIFVFVQFRFPLITPLSHIDSRLSRERATSGPVERRMAFRPQTIRCRPAVVTVVIPVGLHTQLQYVHL